MSIDDLRQEALEKINQDENNISLRTCWDCNHTHEHLKESPHVIFCSWGCGRWFYKGQDITL